MRQQLEGTQAVARAMALARPAVSCADPISPQTPVVEALGRLVKNGGRWPFELAAFERLGPWYCRDAPRTVRPQLDRARRSDGFDAVQGGPTEDSKPCGARRRLGCGNGFDCDNCYGMCPDDAVVKPGPGQRFECNDDGCEGCGICVAECPCGAIDTVPAPS